MIKKDHKYLNLNTFSQLLLHWNANNNNRVMPWKGENNAYKIWLSEIILQQTRVEQGLAYYNRFVENFPTIWELAQAVDQKVFKLWEGLGYYSRCRNLLATARYICNEKQGLFPETYSEILALKGIGPYTAAAIASFAYNLPHAVVDGNVFRVLARVFGIQTPTDTTEGRQVFNKMAQDLLCKSQPGLYNQAIMDFGATVCKPAAPLCSTCIFRNECLAFSENKIDVLPVKIKKLIIKTRHFYFFELNFQNKIILTERKEKDIWRHLYTFPHIELSDENQTTEAIQKARELGWLNNVKAIEANSTPFTQKLTHQTIKASFIKVDLACNPESGDTANWIYTGDLSRFSFPKVINSYLSSTQKPE